MKHFNLNEVDGKKTSLVLCRKKIDILEDIDKQLKDGKFPITEEFPGRFEGNTYWEWMFYFSKMYNRKDLSQLTLEKGVQPDEVVEPHTGYRF